MTAIAELLADDARFTVDGYRGIAFYARGATTERRYADDELICTDEECIHDMWTCYLIDDEGDDVPTGMIDVVMVGDDRVFTVDPDDCTLIADDDYCSGCGQVGCHAYA